MKARTQQNIAQKWRDNVGTNHPAGQLFSSVYAESEIALGHEQLCPTGLSCSATSIVADAF